MPDKPKFIRPRQDVNPSELLQEALEIISVNQKNLLMKVKSGQELKGHEMRIVHDTIKSIATLKEVQLKSLELEKKHKDMQQKALEDMTDDELKEELLKLAERAKGEDDV